MYNFLTSVHWLKKLGFLSLLRRHSWCSIILRSQSDGHEGKARIRASKPGGLDTLQNEGGVQLGQLDT